MSTEATHGGGRERERRLRPSAQGNLAAAGWVERAGSLLRAAGYRGGGARSALLRLLAEESCALTVPEIEASLSRAGRAVSRASIYRNLEQLVELGLVVRLARSGMMARYERADTGSGHHHHLFCERCGAVAPFADGALERAISALCRRLPYAVSGHEIQLWGTCGSCGSRDRKPAHASARGDC
jgi:Fur family ferric uptake transcriptional regulator